MRLYLSILLVLPSLLLHAQHTLCFQEGEGSTCTSIADSSQVEFACNDWLKQQWEAGFLAASIDSVITDKDSSFAFTYSGEKFKALRFKEHNIPIEFLSQETHALSLDAFNKMVNRLLKYYQENGSPFASIRLLEAFGSADSIHARMFFDPGIDIVYDSIEVVGSSQLSKKYLQRYLGIVEGDEYRQSSIDQLDKRLNNLPLVRLTAKSRVYYFQGLARVILFLDEQVTDRFDGVIGVAPNSENTEENKLLVTGELNLELNNLFNNAREFELHWRNYLQRSQRLETSLAWPYLFGTKLGVVGSFELNKYDTFFVNNNSSVGFRYQRFGNNYLQFYYQNNSSNLITVDTASVRTSASLPSNNPFRIDNYGIKAVQRSFDFLPNPRRGFELKVDIAVGRKSILRNSLIDAVRFYHPDQNQSLSIYDTLRSTSFRSRLELETKWFIPLFENATLVNQVVFNGLFAKKVLFNEYYNFGGFSSLQGFDERSLFANRYALYRLEYRYLFSRSGYFGLFFNTAIIEDPLKAQGIADWPYGFGVSSRIEVDGGSLQLAYALGSQKNNPLRFNAAKIHFGIVNYF